MTKSLCSASIVLIVVLAAIDWPLRAAPTWAQLDQLCATPGRDGTLNPATGVVNTYYPSPPTGAIASAGGTILPVDAPNPNGSTEPIVAGDLILVIQIQDAAIDASNTDAYGNGILGGGNDADLNLPPQITPPGASGSTALNSTGLYEYVVATGPISGGTIPVRGAGAGDGLLNTYTSASASAVQGQRRYQAIRVPQYDNAMVAGLTAAPWNGTSGGIVAIDVAGTLTLGSVDVSELGFRGGGARQLSGVGTSSAVTNRDYRSSSTLAANASKGEGIAGTPRYIFDGLSVSNTGAEGYPNGSFGRGAPGNAGGGGTDGNVSANDENSGGGGGGNGGYGGQGGQAWNSSLYTGGFGGTFSPSLTRQVLGGGGGAGTRNNSAGTTSSGGIGGGMVAIRAGEVTGSGTIVADGGSGPQPDNDSGGGGGAGGTVLVLTARGGVPGLSVVARGGRGTDGHNPGVAHGPGGGGGGGFVVVSGGAAVDVSGGDHGLTDVDNNASTNNSIAFGATDGQGGISMPGAIDDVPGADSGSECPPNVRLVKRITRVGSTPITAVLDDPDDSNDTLPFWPSSFIVGGGVVNLDEPTDPADAIPTQPGDEVEYTIYFLSDGFKTAQSVQVCDLVPTHQTFVADAFNAVLPAPGGVSGVDRGVVVSWNGSTLSHTNVSDGDAVRFYPPGAALPSVCDAATSSTGAIVVSLNNLPPATAAGTPTDSFGYIQFRARVN